VEDAVSAHWLVEEIEKLRHKARLPKYKLSYVISKKQTLTNRIYWAWLRGDQQFNQLEAMERALAFFGKKLAVVDAEPRQQYTWQEPRP